IGGVSVPELKTKIAPNTADFMNNGVFRGAYGPRVRESLPAIVRTLKQDRDSRRAVLTIFDSRVDLFQPQDTRDYPCTVALHFLLRDDHLECHAFMRSNDVWWGLTYDAFVFTQLQLTLAGLLDAASGTYFHTATSLHMYERDFNKWQDLTAPVLLDFYPLGFADVGGVYSTRVRAHALLSTGQLVLTNYETESQLWYRDVIFRGRKVRAQGEAHPR
ncbi:MAG: thymidylate synthase, partial [Vicinamibacterales bacterium]